MSSLTQLENMLYWTLRTFLYSESNLVYVIYRLQASHLYNFEIMQDEEHQIRISILWMSWYALVAGYTTSQWDVSIYIVSL
jgi:hypothetical protein